MGPAGCPERPLSAPLSAADTHPHPLPQTGQFAPSRASSRGQPGLTRFSFILMDRRLSLTELHYLTSIPKPTLSMYKTGRRPISHGHRHILSIALDVPVAALVGYVDTEIIVMSDSRDPEPTPEPTPEPPTEPSHPPTLPDS